MDRRQASTDGRRKRRGAHWVAYRVAYLGALLTAACGSGSGSGGGPDGDPDPPLPPLDHLVESDVQGHELSLSVEVACWGLDLLAVWNDRRAGEMDVHAAASADGGGTWERPDERLDGGVAGAYSSWLPKVGRAGDRVAVVWYDERNGFNDVYLQRSADRGQSWAPSDVRVNQGGFATGTSREPAVAMAGETVVVVWQDDRLGGWSIFANVSPDGGATWMAEDVRVDRGAPLDPNATQAQVAHADGTFVAAWLDARDGGTAIYASRSTDGGATWSALDTRLSADLGGDGAAGPPRVAAAGSAVHVAWRDTRDGLGDIYAASSADGGATWPWGEARLDTDFIGVAESRHLDVAAADGSVFVVWQDDRDGFEDVRFQRSADGGATWMDDDVRLDTDSPGVSRSLVPRIAADGAHVGVVWQDDRDGLMDVRVQYSPDGGEQFLAMDARADDDEPGAAHSLAPAVGLHGALLFVAWSDMRAGSGDIFGRAFSFVGPP